ncbi:MAG: crotonase/enoyl-CoA hydratase family protein [Candidatus Protistobacter heckmanni]|nr:crotonase/enoyl-CoA hydratase family protein [Candidatus Protistobacter heckmanni]
MNQAASDPQGEVRLERRGHVHLICLSRPAKLNGITPKMLRELAEAYTVFEDDPEARCAVLHADGAHFTAGLDLPSFAPYMQRGEKVFPFGLVEPNDLGTPGFRRRGKPLVAAVKGITFTIGIELMLAADIVVSAADGRFSQLEVKRGIMATGGATLRMVERAGWGNAMLHLLTGDEFNAEEALRLGFVQQVVAPGEELGRAIAIAEAIAAQAPMAVYATRLNAQKAIEHSMAAAVADFVSTQSRLAKSQDAAEGVASFKEKRPVRFAGQ